MRCLPYFYTWCGLSANLECRSEMCCTWLAENTWRKNLASAHHRTKLSCYIFTTKASINNRKKLVKQQYLLHKNSQYGELWPSNGWDRLACLGHPRKFQWVLRLDFVTAPTSLDGGQPNFALFIQVLHFSILAALLHSTRAVGISQTLQHETRKFGRVDITWYFRAT